MVTIKCLAKYGYDSTSVDWYKSLAVVTITMSENLREPLLDSKATYMLQVKFDLRVLILIKPNLILNSDRRQRKLRINLG